MMRKILVIVYNLDRALEHEWYVQLMDRSRYEIHFAVIRQCHGFLATYLESQGLPVHRFEYQGKIGLPTLTWKLFRLIKKERFDMVHAHLFEASISGMIAARLARTRVRVVTRHHSDFHHRNSRLAVKMDQLVNRLSTHLIAVSRNVQQILVEWEGVSPEKVTVIPHGIDVDSFGEEAVSASRVAQMRDNLALNPTDKVIGMVSRFIDWKGIQFAIDAFSMLRDQRTDVVLVLANAQGPYRDQILLKLQKLPLESYRLVPFEKDVPALYMVFDCFVHVPVSPTAEAFGQTYIEALASRIPSVITISGVAHDYAVHGKNCLVVSYKDSESIYAAMVEALDQNTGLQHMKIEGRKLVEEKYNFKLKYAALDRFYSLVLGHTD